MFLIQSSGGGHHYTQHKTSQIIGGGEGEGEDEPSIFLKTGILDEPSFII